MPSRSDCPLISLLMKELMRKSPSSKAQPCPGSGRRAAERSSFHGALLLLRCASCTAPTPSHPHFSLIPSHPHPHPIPSPPSSHHTPPTSYLHPTLILPPILIPIPHPRSPYPRAIPILTPSPSPSHRTASPFHPHPTSIFLPSSRHPHPHTSHLLPTSHPHPTPILPPSHPHIHLILTPPPPTPAHRPAHPRA